MRKLRSNNGIFLFFVHDKPNILLQLKNKEEVIALTNVIKNKINSFLKFISRHQFYPFSCQDKNTRC